MPWSVYREHFGDPDPMIKAKRSLEPLSVSTMSYLEFDIARELCMSHAQFRALSRRERKQWTFYFILRSEKEKFFYDKSREEAERKSQLENPSPTSRFR